jgi:tetratricopeptide (TPR) repeat protein
LAQTARPYVKGPQQLEWLHRLDAEHSNIRAALRHFLDAGAGDSALRTCFALKEAWDARARYTEARRWLLEARVSAGGGAARACGDAALGLFTFRQGDIDVALDLETSAADAFEQHGMLSEQAEATSNAGFIQMILGRTDESVALGERALSLARESGDAWMISWTLNAVACAYYEAGRRDLAWELLREAVRVGHEIGDRRLLIPPLSNLGEQATAEGKLDEALRYTMEAIELARAVGDIGFLSNGLLNIGMVFLFRGDLSGLAGVSHEAIDLAVDHGIRPPLVEWMFISAAAFAVLAAREQAVRLWSAGQANLVGTFDVLSPIIRTSRQKFLEPLRDQLDKNTFDAAWEEGRILALEDAAREARQIGDLT